MTSRTKHKHAVQIPHMAAPKTEKSRKGMKSLAESTPKIPKPSIKAKAADKDVPEAEPTVMGRPTTFRAEYIPQAQFLAKLGATDPEMADFFEIGLRTLNRWKVTHPEFSEAIKIGKSTPDDRVENSLYHKALGTEVEEVQAIKLKRVKFDGSGKKIEEEEYVEVVPVKRVIPADTTACIFWLKNRRQQQWRDVHKHEHGSANEFDNKTDAELDEIIKEGAKDMLPDLVRDLKPGRPTTKH